MDFNLENQSIIRFFIVQNISKSCITFFSLHNSTPHRLGLSLKILTKSIDGPGCNGTKMPKSLRNTFSVMTFSLPFPNPIPDFFYIQTLCINITDETSLIPFSLPLHLVWSSIRVSAVIHISLIF